MHRLGHHVTGMLTGVMIAGVAQHNDYAPFSVAVMAIPAGWYGGVFPDSIEKFFGMYWIPHRTLTHWVPLWVALCVLTAWFPWESLTYGTALSLIAAGFAGGGITHLLFDWPNPTGIPFIHPWKRHSLNLWRSGNADSLIVAAWGGAAYALWNTGLAVI